MADLISQLAAQARTLPPQDRARLAEELLASLDPQDTEIASAWSEELRRRLDEIESGHVELIPAEQAIAEIRRSLGS